MIPLRILVAHEPRVYRETLSSAFMALRPEADVRAVDPAELDAALVSMQPHLVLCSRLTAAVEAILAWVVLYPDGANLVEVGIGGVRSVSCDITLDGLLAVVDRITSLAQLSQTKFPHPGDGATVKVL